MTFSFMANRKGLLAAVQAVASVAPSRSPKVILQSLKLTVSPDEGSTLQASDLEIGITYRIQGIKADRPGSVILPTARIQQILATADDDELAIEVDGPSLMVRGLRSKFALPTDDPDLFPEVPDFDATDYISVAAADLRRLIRRTIFATDVESTRYALGGVLVSLGDGELSFIGTDGRRLAKQSSPADMTAEMPAIGMPVIPVKALKQIDRNIDDDDPPVHLAFTGPGGQPNAVVIRTATCVIYSRLVEGRFPRYQDVFPAKCEQRIPLEVGPLKAATGQATIMTSDESRGVDFDFASGTLTLSAQAADVGSSTIELPIAYEGPTISLTLDPRYLSDSLKNLDDGSTMTAELVDHKTAAHFKTEDGYSYIIMPLTRER